MKRFVESIVTAMTGRRPGRPIAFSELVQAYEAGRIGELRELLASMDGFDGAQQTARLLETVASRHGLTAMWALINQMHAWHR